MSTIVALDFGNSRVRISLRPFTFICAPSHVAFWLPLANRQVPEMQYPPGTGSASNGEPGGPQARMPSTGPKISFATPGSRYAADIEHPLLWHTTQAVEPSAAEIASVTRANSDGFISIPPIEQGCSRRKNPPSFNALTTDAVSSRRWSIASPSCASRGCSASARATWGWTSSHP